MQIRKHLETLGLKVEDRITGFTGIVSSVSFDLYGCVQGLITPPVNKEGKTGDSFWVDLNRLKIKDKSPVMPIPTFDFGNTPKDPKGPEVKPIKI